MYYHLPLVCDLTCYLNVIMAQRPRPRAGAPYSMISCVRPPSSARCDVYYFFACTRVIIVVIIPTEVVGSIILSDAYLTRLLGRELLNEREGVFWAWRLLLPRVFTQGVLALLSPWAQRHLPHRNWSTFAVNCLTTGVRELSPDLHSC